MFVCLRSKNLLHLFFLFLIHLKEAFLHFEDFCEEKCFCFLFFIFLFLSKETLHIKNLIVGSQHEYKTSTDDSGLLQKQLDALLAADFCKMHYLCMLLSRKAGIG